MHATDDECWIDEFFGEEMANYQRKMPRGFTREQVDFVVKKTGASPQMSVLDVCCGIGRHSLELARRGFKVVGIDRNEACLASAR